MAERRFPAPWSVEVKITNEQSNTTQGTYAMSEHHYHAVVWIDHARAIAVRAGRRPDCERLLFAIVDGLEDYKLTAPAFILRQAQQVLCAPAVARRSLAPPARAKVDRDLGDGIGDFTADLSL
jgi:hypothetical protein